MAWRLRMIAPAYILPSGEPEDVSFSTPRFRRFIWLIRYYHSIGFRWRPWR